jgi:hypothetical protein
MAGIEESCKRYNQEKSKNIIKKLNNNNQEDHYQESCRDITRKI